MFIILSISIPNQKYLGNIVWKLKWKIFSTQLELIESLNQEWKKSSANDNLIDSMPVRIN